MKHFTLALLFVTLSSQVIAATYCGRVSSNPNGTKQIIDGRFDPWIDDVDFAALSPEARQLLADDNCVCVKGTIEERTYPGPQGSVFENHFTQVKRVRQSQGCTE